VRGKVKAKGKFAKFKRHTILVFLRRWKE
jgi:hypothetical protein